MAEVLTGMVWQEITMKDSTMLQAEPLVAASLM
jgi:hypothetical protein